MIEALVLLVVLAAWVSMNWLAPRTLLIGAERIGLGRLPAELVVAASAQRVEFYLGRVRYGTGFSAWSWPRSFVVFDRGAFQRATPELKRYLIAHELAHFALRHPQWRFAAVVSGVVLLPWVRRALARAEDTADAMAERMTGLRREFFDQLRPKAPSR